MMLWRDTCLSSRPGWVAKLNYKLSQYGAYVVRDTSRGAAGEKTRKPPSVLRASPFTLRFLISADPDAVDGEFYIKKSPRAIEK